MEAPSPYQTNVAVPEIEVYQCGPYGAAWMGADDDIEGMWYVSETHWETGEGIRIAGPFETEAQANQAADGFPPRRALAIVAAVTAEHGTALTTPEEIAESSACPEIASELVFRSIVTHLAGDRATADALAALVVEVNTLRDRKLSRFVVGRIVGDVVRLEILGDETGGAR